MSLLKTTLILMHTYQIYLFVAQDRKKYFQNFLKVGQSNLQSATEKV